MRQLLADGVSGSMVGPWLPVPEALRLSTWDLLCQWARRPGERVQPRLELQLVHEAALYTRQTRQSRCLSQKGFEVANGLPCTGTQNLNIRYGQMTFALVAQAATGQLRPRLGDP